MSDRARGRGARGARGGDRGAARGRGGPADRGRGGTPTDTQSIGTSHSRGSAGDSGSGPRGGGRGGRGGRGAAPARGGAPSTNAPAGPGQAAPSTVDIASNVEATGVKRPGFGKQGTAITLDVNLFEVQIPKTMIYHYDDFAPEVKNKSLKMEIFKKMQSLPEFRSVVPAKGVYDSEKQYFSTVSLGPARQFQVTLRKAYTIRLKHAADINPELVHQYLQGRMTMDNKVSTIINACNVAVRMGLIDEYPVYNKRSFFMRDAEWKTFRNPKYAGMELWRGYFQSIRPIMGRMAVNIDISTGVVFKKAPLTVLCLQFLGERNVNNVQRLQNMQPYEREGLNRFVRGLKIFTDGKEDGSRSTIKSISDKPASAYNFKMQDGTSTTVAKYFQSKGTPLRFPNLPCAEAIMTGNAFPIEKCMVATQLLAKQVDPDMVNDVLQFSTLKPQMRLQSIRNGFQFLKYESSPYLVDFGMSVNPNPIRVQGRILKPPEMQYTGNTARPAQGVWKTGKFMKPAEIRGWILISYVRPDMFSPQQATAAAKMLFEACTGVGMRFRVPLPVTMPKNPQRGDFVADINEAVARYRAEKKVDPNLVVVVLPTQGASDIYAAVKHAGDVAIGVPTQCLLVNKITDPRAEYFQNVALKINVKLGGVNTYPKATDVRFLADPNNPTLILGADVMHQKSSGEEGLGRPSFAACTGSVDLQGCKYMGLCTAQETRKEQIINLEAMVTRIIGEYKTNNPGKLPKRVLYYRDGVDEGQFATVLKEEIPQIRAACRKTGLGSPKITCMIVGKRHHIRLFPVAGADRSGNAPAGTIVDSGITSSVEFDFYLQSHAGLLGTSRSAHYNVLLDENLFAPDDLQSLSFALCHVYARCTRSVSLPAPVYYAHLVCFRANHRFDPKKKFDLDRPVARTMTSDQRNRMLQEYIDAFLDLHANTEKVMYFQ